MRICLHRSALTCVAVVFVLGLCRVGQVEAYPAKNVILMIADGQGFNTVDATRYYTGSAAVYEGFAVQYGMSTYSASNPAGYNPALNWSNFAYKKSGATDSAAAATTMYSGVKTNDGYIGKDPAGFDVLSIAEMASSMGKKTGAVSSVQLSHATPAAVDAHNISRNNYAQIANEMFLSSDLDVIMGAGHPYYDNNGNPTTSSGTYVGGIATWNALGTGANGFTRIDAKTDFEALADGTYNGGVLPSKVAGVAQVATTLQYQRSGAPFNTNVPDLQTMTSGALNVLSQDPDGMFLMVEGGAVDWAGHGNNLTRQIEEEIDFNNSVQSVVDWVDANSNWNETLLIVTADHETGYLWGSATDPLGALLTDNGVGNLPGHVWNYGSHTNQLVPMYAKGAGSELFAGLIDGTDAQAGTFWGFSGDYIDNTDLFTTMSTAMTADPVPEPSTLVIWSLLGLCGVGWWRRQSRKA